MKRTLYRFCWFFTVLFSNVFIHAQVNMTVLPLEENPVVIDKHIYGHFAEHLGRCIYDGFYVGESSQIPHTNGVRNDVIQALRDLKIPNLRWPGGCFADTYHWKDAIGPKSERKHIENLAWGNIREDNSFGTNEFLNLCEILNAEPYLAVNMNSGTVQEAVEWVQYTNHKNGTSYLTDIREKSGRNTPWQVKYWGIGNESWDCGGAMTAEHYTNLYKQYATAMTSYGNSEKLFRIAVGPGTEDYDWTETVMKNIPVRRMEGVSVHHYSVFNWSNKGSSTAYSDEEYFLTMNQAWKMDRFIQKNCEVMDKYDPKKEIALIVDEWGGWYETDKEGKGALYQQNTMRDAMIAGMTLHIFHKFADRVRMANLAQTINVLQAVLLTKEDKMIRTPTYHVMKMLNVHQDAKRIPLEFVSPEFVYKNQSIPAMTATASLDAKNHMHISLANVDLLKAHEVSIQLPDRKFTKVKATILQSADIRDHNTFDHPEKVKPEDFKQYKLSGTKLTWNMPAHSVIVFSFE